jgi:hypothetical protein
VQAVGWRSTTRLLIGIFRGRSCDIFEDLLEGTHAPGETFSSKARLMMKYRTSNIPSFKAFLVEYLEGLHMPSSQLKRAERAIEAIRDQAELPLEAADALQELVDIIRNIEDRVSALEKAKVVLT